MMVKIALAWGWPTGMGMLRLAAPTFLLQQCGDDSVNTQLAAPYISHDELAPTTIIICNLSAFDPTSVTFGWVLPGRPLLAPKCLRCCCL
jgi:hypothetical protein